MQPGIRRNYRAQGAIGRYRFATFGTADGTVKQAADDSATIIGVAHDIDLVDGERGDIVRDDFPGIEYGGAVTRGDYLTADSEGRAIPITPPAAGETVHYGGIAEVSGVVGDICPVWLEPGVLIRPAA
jgi:hypothetical protein